jgi:hypothetical protein
LLDGRTPPSTGIRLGIANAWLMHSRTISGPSNTAAARRAHPPGDTGAVIGAAARTNSG